MRIWLDDYRNPKDQFIIDNYGADPTLFWVKTPWQMADLIKSGVVTYIDFDHDLGTGWSSPADGYELAKLIEELAFKNKIKRIKWDVHSDNPAGRRKIIMAMKAAENYWTQHEHEHGGEG
jgi:hypothetical protein